MLQTWFNKLWYEKNNLAFIFWPFSLLFRLVVKLRLTLYQWQLLKTQRFPIPIIIVGNLTVGGTGKTPLVLFIVKELQQAGFKPGIISRGYGGKLNSQPVIVNANHTSLEVGDEVKMMASHSHCPLVIAKNRAAAVATLFKNTDCNVVVSDDGLQHYALHRDIEIVVIDGQRRFGNGMCLPAGPLREPIKRLSKVNFIVCNGDDSASQEYRMILKPQNFINIKTREVSESASFVREKIHAIAGIANPARFFKTLSDLGLSFAEHVFPDHYPYEAGDLLFAESNTIVMTEKDAIKCQSIANENFWYLQVVAECEKQFMIDLLDAIRKVNVSLSHNASG